LSGFALYSTPSQFKLVPLTTTPSAEILKIEFLPQQEPTN
jgi:hypothetical protein